MRCATQTHKYHEHRISNASDWEKPNSNQHVSRAENLQSSDWEMPNSNPQISRARNWAENHKLFRWKDTQLKPTNIKEDSADAQFKPTSIKGRKLSRKPWILRTDRCSTETHKYQGRETQEKILNSSAWQITQLKPTSMKRRKLQIFKLTDAQLKPTSMKNRKSSNLQIDRCRIQTHQYEEQKTQKKISNSSDWEMPNSKQQNLQVSRAENLHFFRLKNAQLNQQVSITENS